MTPQTQQKKDLILEAMQRGFTKLLDDAKVPQREHLKVVSALAERMNAHKKDIEAHALESQKHESIDAAHERQIAVWDETSRHLRSITHLKGEKGDKGEAGLDAKAVDIDTLVSHIIELIPVPKDGEPGEKGADAVFNEDKVIGKLIERLKKDKPLDISHIRNAQTFIKDGVRYRFEELMHGAGSNSSAGNVVYNEVVSGSGTAWVLAHTPTNNSLQLYANGQRLTPTVDYSVAGTAITTVDSWATGTILADYSY